MPSEKYELIITEKPKVSLKIAQSLAEGSVTRKLHKKVSYYEIERKGKKIVVAPAVGHVFTLKEEAGTHDFPIFKIEWVPSYDADKKALYTKDYVDTLRTLAKNASSFVNACDYDIEGSLIGYNVLKFVCGEEAVKKAKRMKFSALTQNELVKSYEGKAEALDFPMVDAGITRHVLDWYWGVNTSRALSYVYKSVSGRYLTLSAGRVQTPTLKVLDEKEHEIKKFVPKPFWVLSAKLQKNSELIDAVHEAEKFFDEQKAKSVFEKVKNSKTASVADIKNLKFKQEPPHPFNLGDLQIEAYKLFKYTPQRTQAIAQNLYEQGLISYPRTSSQKLPKGVDPKEILKKIGENSKYSKLTEILLKENVLKANEGSKEDEAHPCIHPTGEKASNLQQQEEHLYDLIVKRFMATFGKSALRTTQIIRFNINNEFFISKGSRTIEEGWHIFYKPYVKLEEIELPALEIKEILEVKKISIEQKETLPPKRYSPASIIREMEKLGIGTKATRATILQTLYDRNYIEGTQITVTPFGSMIVKTLVENVPELTSEKLTREFEKDIEEIQSGKFKKEVIIEKAEKTLAKIMAHFKEHSAEIGKKLVEEYKETAKEQSVIGVCPKCGKNLIIRVSRASHKQFVGCSGYPKCNCSYPLPQVALIIKTAKLCPFDNLPVVEVRRKGKRRFEMCIDSKCKSKENWSHKVRKEKTKKE